MGLDLVVEGCAKPGHGAEWRQLLQKSFDGADPDPSEVERFEQISIPAYEHLGAPRVGTDPEADSWIIEQRGASTPEQIEAALREFDGYYVVRLVKSDGVPEYSHGGLYDGVDETSFRGAFLSGCTDLLSKRLIDAAWDHKFPDEATEYGRALIAASKAAQSLDSPVERRPGLLGRLLGSGGSKQSSEFSIDEQRQIVEAAGKWFLFWGERGHAIRAWF